MSKGRTAEACPVCRGRGEIDVVRVEPNLDGRLIEIEDTDSCLLCDGTGDGIVVDGLYECHGTDGSLQPVYGFAHACSALVAGVTLQTMWDGQLKCPDCGGHVSAFRPLPIEDYPGKDEWDDCVATTQVVIAGQPKPAGPPN